MDKPNVVLPLAPSYNERGLTGFSNTNAGLDQAKINCFFEPVQNAAAGTKTLYLTKRPGISEGQQSIYASVNVTTRILTEGPDDGQAWVFAHSTYSGSTATLVATAAAITTITSYPNVIVPSSKYGATFVDRTRINGTAYVVVQIVHDLVVSSHHTFYSSSLGTWTEIVSTFSTIAHRGKMEFMDGFAFQMDASSRIYNPNINTISTWPAANFITKQIQQDRAVGLARLNNHILAFGEETAEVFANGGLSPAPLIPLKHLADGVGMVVSSVDASHYYATLRNRLYFCGRPKEGGTAIGAYFYNGERFEKFSPPYIDKILVEANPSSVETVIFQGQEAIAFRLSNLNASPQRWMMYFPRWNDWFEWNSVAFRPINNGRYFLSMNNLGTFNFTDSNKWFDATAASTYAQSVRFKIPVSGYNKKKMDYFGLVGDTFSTQQSSLVSVATSDNDWQTTTARGTIDMGSEQKIITRMGNYRDRGIVLTHDANMELRLQYAVAKVSE